MENASKALLISGGILIALLIISIGVYLYITYSQIGDTYEKNLTANEIMKFNNHFTEFEGRQNITAQEILTLYNFIQEQSRKNDNLSSKIYCGKSPSPLNFREDADKIDFLEKIDDSGKLLKYKCDKCESISYNEQTGLVSEINFDIT